MLVTMIRAGANLGKSFVPDISVGQRWGKYWRDEHLEVLYGERRQYNHHYPLYFPQAASNPQPACCYPDDALPEFRKWVREQYIPKMMPTYLNGKIRDGSIPAPMAKKALDAFTPKRIG